MNHFLQPANDKLTQSFPFSANTEKVPGQKLAIVVNGYCSITQYIVAVQWDFRRYNRAIGDIN